MGIGNWSVKEFKSYSSASKSGATYDSTTGKLRGLSSTQDVYKQNYLNDALNPRNVMRECCDSEEHPNTIPVILALDVTGSMGGAALEVAKSLNAIMTALYKEVTDVEFCIMGIGDLAYDRAPIQISQFESDIRIAEQLDKIYFEGGGGGNDFESYTAAWYMGLYHTKLDCWKRGKKGIIITLGDEYLNPYLPLSGIRCDLASVTGDNLQAEVETKKLYDGVKEKYDVYHIDVKHGSHYTSRYLEESFTDVIGKDNFFTADINSLPDVITKIVVDSQNKQGEEVQTEEVVAGFVSGEGISW